MLGQYRPLDSFLHRLDARSKLLPIMAFLILALLSTSFVFYLIILFSLVAALSASKISGAALRRNLWPLFWLVFMTSSYHILFPAEESRVLLELSGLKITALGLESAGFYSLRLVLFVSISFLITLTSSPSDLADSIARLLRPLEKFRIPIDDLALIVFIAIRFIPVLYEEFAAIKNAQIMRGVSFSGSFLTRVRKSTTIIIPLFLAAINRADQIAMAIAVRSGRQQGKKIKRTYYSSRRFGAPDWTFMLLSTLFVLTAYYLTANNG